MNINPIIERIFANFVVDGKVIPIKFMHYNGKATAFLTYYAWSEKPKLFADDNYHAEVTNGTVDVFSQVNYKSIVSAVKEKLQENGITWSDSGAEFYEADTEYFHVPINFVIGSNLV